MTLHCLAQVSESLVQQDGEFLVRDSLTSIGDYVLTCRWNQKTLNFLISKVLLRSHDGYSRTQYILEGETFDSVPALVHSYVVNPRPLTKQSGAYVYSQVNRTIPLRYLEAMFGLPSAENSPVNLPTSRRGSQKMRESVTVTEALEIEQIHPQRSTLFIYIFHHKCLFVLKVKCVISGSLNDTRGDLISNCFS